MTVGFLIKKESLKKELDNSGLVGKILIDLSKVYDCLHHDLLMVKVEAYGLDKPSLNLVNDYLRFRKQSRKIGSSYGDWVNVTMGIPHNSILGLYFLIFLSIIFFYLLKNLIYANFLTVIHCSLVEIISP